MVDYRCFGYIEGALGEVRSFALRELGLVRGWWGCGQSALCPGCRRPRPWPKEPEPMSATTARTSSQVVVERTRHQFVLGPGLSNPTNIRACNAQTSSLLDLD